MLKQCNTIIFDLGGVVLNINYNATVAAFKKLGGENFDKLYQQAHQDKIFDQYDVGAITSTEFRNYLKQFIHRSIDISEIDNAWNAMLLDLPEERVKLLEKLSGTHRIFLLSNTNEIHFAEFRRRIKDWYHKEDLLETIFEKTYYSHLLGKRKPNIETFQHVIDENQLNASTTLFIDDSEQHIEGARKAGLQAHHLNQGTIVDIFR